MKFLKGYERVLILGSCEVNVFNFGAKVKLTFLGGRGMPNILDSTEYIVDIPANEFFDFLESDEKSLECSWTKQN